MKYWKEIEGFDGGYLISSDGEVYSNRNNKLLKQIPRKHGYLSVWLYGKDKRPNGRKGKAYSVHRLVASAFIPNPEGKSEVNHLNEVKTDNRAANLEWVTHEENSNFGTRGKRISEAGTNGKQSKVTYQLSLDGEVISNYPSVHEAARANGYSIGNICKAIADPSKTAYGYRWSH